MLEENPLNNCKDQGRRKLQISGGPPKPTTLKRWGDIFLTSGTLAPRSAAPEMYAWGYTLSLPRLHRDYEFPTGNFQFLIEHFEFPIGYFEFLRGF